MRAPRVKVVVGCLCAWLFAACARPSEQVRAAPADNSGCSEVTVSYYADELAGRRTANGETYRLDKMTAAHRTLPFGTLVSLEYHGKVVVVRVNDRGPFVRGVTFDLSHAAAAELEMIRAGHARVRMCPR